MSKIHTILGTTVTSSDIKLSAMYPFPYSLFSMQRWRLIFAAKLTEMFWRESFRNLATVLARSMVRADAGQWSSKFLIPR